MRTSLTRLLCAGFALAVLAGAGCSGGDSLHPVTGKVTYKGQPLKGALVTLHPTGNNDPKVHRPIGLSQGDGCFNVTTGEREGAAAGEYVVTIIGSVTPPAPDGKKPKAFSTGEPDTVDLFNGAYSNADTSKTTVTVKAGKNELATFDLK